MVDELQPYAQLMRSRGFRFTPQRQLILGAMRECGGHTTPDEIYERVHAKVPAINRTTVYRTLEFLLAIGVVTTAHIKENRVIYELAPPTPHHHLICRRCDHTEQVEHGLVAPLFHTLEQTFHFTIQTDHLVLFGLCDRCRSQETANPVPE
jgi:Fur family ferric uptake transcriptional regulator